MGRGLFFPWNAGARGDGILMGEKHRGKKNGGEKNTPR